MQWKNIVRKRCLDHYYKWQGRRKTQWIRNTNHDRSWHPRIQSQIDNVLKSTHVKTKYLYVKIVCEIVFEDIL